MSNIVNMSIKINNLDNLITSVFGVNFFLLYFEPPSPIESLVELSLHKVALKPVSAHLYSCIHTSRTNNGSFERLQSNFLVLEKNKVQELGGSAGVGVPDSIILERIQQRWHSMHEAYSPNKKIQILLKVCKSIYHSMSANSSSGGLVVICDQEDFRLSYVSLGVTDLADALISCRDGVWSR